MKKLLPLLLLTIYGTILADNSFISNNASHPVPVVISGGGGLLPSQTGNGGKFLTTDGTIASWATVSGGGDALTTNPLSQFAATTSAQFKGVISDENAPDGASSKVIMALGSLSIASGKTGTFSNTLTLAGTDGSTLNVGAGGTLGTAALLASDTDGTLTANSDSRIPTQKAVKTYVDTSLSSFDVKPDVAYGSTTALPANTYANGTSGVGATLTGNANGPLIIDGVTLAVGAVGKRILVAGEATSANNGWYSLTQLGVVAVSPYILTRVTESDEATEIGAGYLTGIVAPNTLTPGSANNGKVFISVAADPFTVGTTSLTFSQVGSTYSAGTGLSLSGSTFSIDTGTTVDKTTAQVLTNKDLTSGTNTFPTLNQNTTGSAAKWTTARTLALTGDVTYTSGSFDGSANATGTATVANIPTTATYGHDLTTIPNETGGWTEYFVTGSDFTTTSTTLVDITGLVSGTLTGGAVYEFEFNVRLLNAADAAGMKIGFHGGGTGSAATVFAAFTGNAGSASAASSAALNAIDTATAAFVVYSAGEGIIFGRGFFTARTTGTPTFSLQVAKVTSNTATVRVGSVVRLRKAHT